MKKKGGSVDFKTMATEARKYLEMLDVHVDPATKLKDLRIGEQQLVEIAKAISLNSEIIKPKSCLQLFESFVQRERELYTSHIEWKKFSRLQTDLL